MSTDAVINSAVIIPFPPRQLVDFVIHDVDGIDFHVHKFVLHYHTVYFRAYFQTLSQSSSSSSSDASQPCNHPHIAHCIHLPQQTRLVEGMAVTAADFRLFLCHLYFASHYRSPPYLPKTDIDLAADAVPLSLHFPPVRTIDWSDESPQLRTTEDGRCSQNEALLTLAYYLDCAAMMQQCEAVLLTQIEYGKENGENA